MAKLPNMPQNIMRRIANKSTIRGRASLARTGRAGRAATANLLRRNGNIHARALARLQEKYGWHRIVRPAIEKALQVMRLHGQGKSNNNIISRAPGVVNAGFYGQANTFNIVGTAMPRVHPDTWHALVEIRLHSPGIWNMKVILHRTYANRLEVALVRTVVEGPNFIPLQRAKRLTIMTNRLNQRSIAIAQATARIFRKKQYNVVFT